jgi:hypothetical protein
MADEKTGRLRLRSFSGTVEQCNDHMNGLEAAGLTIESVTPSCIPAMKDERVYWLFHVREPDHYEH